MLEPVHGEYTMRSYRWLRIRETQLSPTDIPSTLIRHPSKNIQVYPTDALCRNYLLCTTAHACALCMLLHKTYIHIILSTMQFRCNSFSSCIPPTIAFVCMYVSLYMQMPLWVCKFMYALYVLGSDEYRRFNRLYIHLYLRLQQVTVYIGGGNQIYHRLTFLT